MAGLEHYHDNAKTPANLRLPLGAVQPWLECVSRILCGFVFDEYSQSDPPLHSEDSLRKLYTHDIMALCAHLTVVINNQYKKVVALHGLDAQSFLNLLQAVCS
jgi:hypothetical protein